MKMISNRLEVGINLTIKRSDGRLHLANVRGIDFKNRVVEVEWSEGGEIKGKELFFDELLPYNAEIAFRVPPEVVPQDMDIDEEIKHTPVRVRRCLQYFHRPDGSDLCSLNFVEEVRCGGDNHLSNECDIESSVSDMSLEPAEALQAEPPECTFGLSDVTSNEEKYKVMRPAECSISFVELKTENDFMVEPQIPENLFEQTIPEENIEPSGVEVLQIDKSHIEDPGSSGEPACTLFQETTKQPKRKLQKSANGKRQEAPKTLITKKKTAINKTLNRKVKHVYINEIAEQIIKYRLENPSVFQTVNEIVDRRLTIFIRKRPLSIEEMNSHEIDVMTVTNGTELIVHEPKKKLNLASYIENHSFSFDYIFDTNATNQAVFQATLKPLIESTLQGGHSAFLCFGQTGSGKSYTMGGKFIGKRQVHEEGFYALTASEIFKGISGGTYDLTISVFEVYMTHLFDLLNNRNALQVREDKTHCVHVVGLKAVTIKTYDEALTQIQLASRIRSTRQTTLNNNSSRSHCFLEYNLYHKGTENIHGKCILIDLAGNERASDTQKDGHKSREEGAQINKSLLVLKECIRGMGKDSVHLPFRGSKLTHILRPTILNKNNRISILGTVSPSFSSCNHSLDSLKYCSGFYSF